MLFLCLYCKSVLTYESVKQICVYHALNVLAKASCLKKINLFLVTPTVAFHHFVGLVVVNVLTNVNNIVVIPLHCGHLLPLVIVLTVANEATILYF